MVAYDDKFQLVAYHVPTDQDQLGAGDVCAIETDLTDVADQVQKLSQDATLRLKRIIAVAEKALKSNDLTDAYSGHLDHSFRAKPITHSGVKPITDSG